MQLGGRKAIRPVKTWGGYGGGVAVSSVGVAPTWTVGVSASIFFLCSTKPRRFFMMAYLRLRKDQQIVSGWTK